MIVMEVEMELVAAERRFDEETPLHDVERCRLAYATLSSPVFDVKKIHLSHRAGGEREAEGTLVMTVDPAAK